MVEKGFWQGCDDRIGLGIKEPATISWEEQVMKEGEKITKTNHETKPQKQQGGKSCDEINPLVGP